RVSEQLFFAFALQGDIPRDGGGTDHVSLQVADRRERRGHVEELTIFAYAFAFIAIDTKIAFNDIQELGHFTLVCFGNETVNGLTDNLMTFEAVHRLGAFIPARYHAVQGHADDRVLGGFNDRCQLRPRLFGLGADFYIPHDKLAADQPS